MNSVVHSPRLEPKPNRYGFVVDSVWFRLFKRCKSTARRASYPIVPAINMSRYFKPFQPPPRMIPASSHKSGLKASTGTHANNFSRVENLNADRMQTQGDEDFNATIEISLSTVDTLGPETPPIISHNLTLRSKSRSPFLIPVTGSPSLVLTRANSTTDGPVLSSMDFLDTSSAVFDSGHRQALPPAPSVARDVNHGRSGKTAKGIAAANGKENQFVVARQTRRPS